MTATPTETATPTATTVWVEGRIRYFAEDRPVPGVSVALTGAEPQVLETDGAGGFASATLSAGGWRLQPTKTGDRDGGVSSMDATFVLEAIVGKRRVGSYEKLACDVSGDGTLTAFDASLVLQFMTGRIRRLPVTEACGSDWAFVPVPAVLENQFVEEPRMSPGTCGMGAVSYEPLSTPALSQDFVAVLFGDCTGSWRPPEVP